MRLAATIEGRTGRVNTIGCAIESKGFSETGLIVGRLVTATATGLGGGVGLGLGVTVTDLTELPKWLHDCQCYC